tara:strand:- start:8748 stop:9152 length:405 start_codon:yes stop_codon:yes gene_type:complete
LKNILLERFCYHPTATLGVVRVDDELFYSVERPWLDNRVGVSCIPTGVYEMGWRESPRFGETWHIKDVPDRTYILIHVANFARDVEGCIGLGLSLMGDTVAVSESRKAVAKFEMLTKGQDCQLTIENDPYAALI